MWKEYEKCLLSEHDRRSSFFRNVHDKVSVVILFRLPFVLALNSISMGLRRPWVEFHIRSNLPRQPQAAVLTRVHVGCQQALSGKSILNKVFS